MNYKGHEIETPRVKKGSQYCNIFIDRNQIFRTAIDGTEIPVRHLLWNAAKAAKNMVDRIVEDEVNR